MRRRNTILKKRQCVFCKQEKDPWFLESEVLTTFASERGKILPRSRSGLCATHQRRVTKEIKRARFIGLLPTVVRPE